MGKEAIWTRIGMEKSVEDDDLVKNLQCTVRKGILAGEVERWKGKKNKKWEVSWFWASTVTCSSFTSPSLFQYLSVNIFRQHSMNVTANFGVHPMVGCTPVRVASLTGLASWQMIGLRLRLVFEVLWGSAGRAGLASLLASRPAYIREFLLSCFLSFLMR